MVIDNIFRSEKPGRVGADAKFSEMSQEYRLASPMDRLAAAIIDLSIILMPLILLLSSPIKRVMMSSVLVQNDALFFLSILSLVLVSFVTVVAYQSLFHYYFQWTIGKKVFGLRVVSIWGGAELKFIDSLLRSVIWFFETILLFLPHVSIFSDPRRRPIHDRMANTIVIQDRGGVILPPNVYEITFAKSLLAMLVAVIGIYSVQSIFKIAKSLDQNGYISKIMDTPRELCEEVDWAMDSWPKSEANLVDGRLYVALALFAAGEASKDCLKTEVNYFQSKNQTESSVAYLSQAFVHSSNSDLSNKYLKRICEIEAYSSSCAMAKIVENWSDSNWTDVDLGFMSVGEQPPFHMSIWAIRHYAKQRQFDKAAFFVDQLSPQRALGSFLGQYRVRVLWGLHDKVKVRDVANTALENMDLEDRMELGSWLCRREYLDQGCAGLTSSSCQVVTQDIESSNETTADVDMALIAVLQQKCSKESQDIELLSETFMPAELKRYLEAVMQLQAGHLSQGRNLLNEIRKDELLDEHVRLQAELDWIEVAESREVFERVKQWSVDKPSEDWALVGAKLAQRFNQLQDARQAQEIAKKTLEQGFRDDFVLRPLVVALYYQGDKRQAYEISREVMRRNLSPDHSLRPMGKRDVASIQEPQIDPYDRIEKELNRWFYREGGL